MNRIMSVAFWGTAVWLYWRYFRSSQEWWAKYVYRQRRRYLYQNTFPITVTYSGGGAGGGGTYTAGGTGSVNYFTWGAGGQGGAGNAGKNGSA